MDRPRHKRMKALCKEFNLEPLLKHAFWFSFLEGGHVSRHYTVGKWPLLQKADRAFETHRDEATNWSSRTQEILDRKDWWTILRDRGFTREELLRRDLDQILPSHCSLGPPRGSPGTLRCKP